MNTIRFRDIALPLALILLGLLLLTNRLPAQTFTPTRFTVVNAGATGKPGPHATTLSIPAPTQPHRTSRSSASTTRAIHHV